MSEATRVASNEGTYSETVTVETETQQNSTLLIKLKKTKSDKKVQWTTETVDNEEMNKKKSKCCCIYEKPKVFGESSSEEDDDETDHCHGHKKKCFRHHQSHDHHSLEDAFSHGSSVDGQDLPRERGAGGSNLPIDEAGPSS